MASPSSTPTPRTHELFLQIVATVSKSRKGMSVARLAAGFGLPPSLISQCIALHVYQERTHVDQLPLPVPADFWIPRGEEVITPALLEPRDSDATRFVDAGHG